MKRKIGLFTLLLICMPLLASAAIRYDGSTVIAQSILDAGTLKAFEAKTGVKFAPLQMTGTGTGLQALMEGKVDLAGSTRALKAEEKKAELLGAIIGYDALAIWVNASNPLASLSKDQLKGIYTGKITNWKEVGGKDGPIHVITEPLDSKKATLQLVQELLMDKVAYAKPFKAIDLFPDQLTLIAGDGGGICAASLSMGSLVSAEARKNLKAIQVDGIQATDDNIRSGAYLLSRPVILASKGLPQGEVKQFIDFMLSPEGQAIVEKNFVKVKK
jgi:phosphate transport system substrate-binding protein